MKEYYDFQIKGKTVRLKISIEDAVRLRDTLQAAGIGCLIILPEALKDNYNSVISYPQYIDELNASERLFFGSNFKQRMMRMHANFGIPFYEKLKPFQELSSLKDII